MARVAAGVGVAGGMARAMDGNYRVPQRLGAATPRPQSAAPAALSRRTGLVLSGFAAWRGLGGRQRVRSMAAGAGGDLESSIKETIAREPVVVYSKTYCPYCMRVKKLLGSLGYDFEVVELDAGGAPGLQDALERVSGQYTVPNVFIGGKHIGGCDDTVALHSRGQLEPLLQAAGANRH